MYNNNNNNNNNKYNNSSNTNGPKGVNNNPRYNGHGNYNGFDKTKQAEKPGNAYAGRSNYNKNQDVNKGNYQRQQSYNQQQRSYNGSNPQGRTEKYNAQQRTQQGGFGYQKKYPNTPNGGANNGARDNTKRPVEPTKNAYPSGNEDYTPRPWESKYRDVVRKKTNHVNETNGSEQLEPDAIEQFLKSIGESYKRVQKGFVITTDAEYAAKLEPISLMVTRAPNCKKIVVRPIDDTPQHMREVDDELGEIEYLNGAIKEIVAYRPSVYTTPEAFQYVDDFGIVVQCKLLDYPKVKEDIIQILQDLYEPPVG